MYVCLSVCMCVRMYVCLSVRKKIGQIRVLRLGEELLRICFLHTAWCTCLENYDTIFFCETPSRLTNTGSE